MLNQPFYNKTTRKIVAAFGSMFNNITLINFDGDTELSRVKVPLSWGPKEKWLARLLDDSALNKPTMIELPRMSFEMTGMMYDANRKQATTKRLYSFKNGDNKVGAVFNPVPWDFQFSLSVFTRNFEDATQIIEQIIPLFTPDYTVTVDLIPPMNIMKDIPVLLKGVTQEITYQGDGNTTRVVSFTMDFTLKAYLFGDVQTSGLIKTAITNIYDTSAAAKESKITLDVNGIGTFVDEEEVYCGKNRNDYDGRGRVLTFNGVNRHLTLHSVEGSFASGVTIYGTDSGAQWKVISATPGYIKMVKDTEKVTPNTANINSSWFVTDTLEEFPNITGES